jgi:hypothetical protein
MDNGNCKLRIVDCRFQIGRFAAPAAWGFAAPPICNLHFSIYNLQFPSRAPGPKMRRSRRKEALTSVSWFVAAGRGMRSDQKMAAGCPRAQPLGLCRLAGTAAFATSAPAKAPGDWRTPRRFAPTTARPIFTVCGAARRGMLSGPKRACAAYGAGRAGILVCRLGRLSSLPALLGAGGWKAARTGSLERLPYVGVRARNLIGANV